MQHTEIKLNSKEIFKGNVFRVTMDQVELENGMTSFREVVHHNGGACILPLTDDDKVLMVRQYRYALKEELWELPAGKLEKDEDPFEAAKRELEEECGVTAERFINLGVLYPTVGYDSEKIYIWAAKGLKPTSQHLDDGEFLDVAGLPFDDVLQISFSFQKLGLILENVEICLAAPARGGLKCRGKSRCAWRFVTWPRTGTPAITILPRRWNMPGGRLRSAMGRRKSQILYSAGLLALTF